MGGKLSSGSLPSGAGNTGLLDTSDSVLWDSQPPFSPPWLVSDRDRARGCVCQPQMRQLYSPGIIALIRFFSLPGLGKCARKMATVWYDGLQTQPFRLRLKL